MECKMAQQTSPDPIQEFQQKINELQMEISSLVSKTDLSTIRDDVEDLNTNINMMSEKIKDIRTRGYVFGKDLEPRSSALLAQWTRAHPGIAASIDQQSQALRNQSRGLDGMMLQVTSRARTPLMAQPFFSQAETASDALESAISKAESSIRGTYDELGKDIEAIVDQVNKVDEMLEKFAAASFVIRAGEGAIACVKAKWWANGRDEKQNPEGYVYLTDQRLFYEQNEEVATKKVLFITTERKKIQQLLFEFPVELVADVVAVKQGMFKNEDHIDLTLKSGAPYPAVHFHLDGQDCNYWDSLIGKAKTKEFDRDRTVAIPKEDLEKIKNAPANCPKCGGVINQPVLRGQESITCTFCGNVIRL